jgi:hypothetical protein
VLQRRHVLLLLHGVRQLRLSYCCPAHATKSIASRSSAPLDAACAGVSSLLAGWAVASDESIATHNFLLPIQASVPTLSTADAPTVLFLCQLPCCTHTRTTQYHQPPQPPSIIVRLNHRNTSYRPLVQIGRVRHARKLNSVSALGHSYFSYSSSNVWRTFASD